MAGVSYLTPYFDPKLEIAAHKIPVLNLTDCRHHVSAAANMSWPFNPVENTTKYSFAATSGMQFDVDFTGDIRLKLNDRILICLKGARVISRASGKNKLPFKLEFPDGFMAYVDDRVIDTFPVSMEEDTSAVMPSWFNTQPTPQSEPSSPQSSAGSELPSPPSKAHSIISQRSSSQERNLDKRSGSERSPSPPIHSPDPPSTQPATFRSNAHLNQPPPTRQPTAPAKGEPGSSTSRQAFRPSVPNVGLARNVSQPDTSTNESKAPKIKKRKRRKDKKNLRKLALEMTAGYSSALYGPFLPLSELSSRLGSKVNATGIVRGISIPKVSRNGDWCISIELLDPSVKDNLPFLVTLFLPESLKDCIPNVKAGDIIILVKFTVVLYQGKVRGTGHKDAFQWAGYSITQNAHFHSATRDFGDEDHCPFLKPSIEELQYASQIAEWWKATEELSNNKPGGASMLTIEPRGRRLITLSEAKADVFFNCIVEILFKAPPGDQAAEIFVTDYTVHPQFYSREPREDPKTAKQENIKVYGKRVLKVMLWGRTQVEHAHELEPGYYYIDNVRVKFDSKGNLEGTLQDDKRKIDKLRRDDPLLEDLLKRKSEYFSRAPSPERDTSQPAVARGRDPNLHTAGDLLPPPPIPIIPPQQTQPMDKSNKWPITRLTYQNIVQSPLQQVLGHASCPEIFRIRARVAAFEPYTLAHFAHGYCTKCNNDFLPVARACVECDDVEGKFTAYEYRFQLCVEEESPRPSQDGYRASLIVDVFGKDAEKFLGMPAQDFHDLANMRKLRSRLAPIFGNLEAHQADLAAGNSIKARTHGQYFEMLVQSYKSAHKSEGSLDNKRYRLWGTELLSKPPK
ncbi:telomeric single stranded DNA-binding POT1/CDC13 protein [Ceratobasidium sp. AG-Ba]|nr:telomeric single stranded DNA-binding POT1/CDC13 protein [Ceratobasidium sp. AG-Ba]QRW15275.1 telomeric single stranded DNA-binding POT1/CDC13 protein [Ceratobasidium sp. AG-Ba]